MWVPEPAAEVPAGGCGAVPGCGRDEAWKFLLFWLGCIFLVHGPPAPPREEMSVHGHFPVTSHEIHFSPIVHAAAADLSRDQSCIVPGTKQSHNK